jgi:RNA polymerase sporulation-specific sigma factor
MCARISSGASYPKPLSQEEEKIYLELFESGDAQARNVLIERNLRLVSHIVKKYSGNNREIEDLISVGTIGLIKGINAYKSEKGVRLSTFASRCIENEILMSIRASKKLSNNVSLQEFIIDKQGNEVKIEDRIADRNYAVDDQVGDKIEIKKMYEKIKNVLKDREKKVIEDRFGLIDGCEKTQREIAEELGISRSYVSRIEKKALKKLNKEMI